MKRLLLAMSFAFVPSILSAQRVFEAVKDLSISADAEGLEGIGGVYISSKGVIALPQFKDGRIVFFGSNGKLLGSYGRKGEGPGEFRGISGFSGWKADTFVAIDAANNRITLISPAFKTIRMSPLPTGVKAPPGKVPTTYAGMALPLSVLLDNTVLISMDIREKQSDVPWIPFHGPGHGYISVAMDGTFRRAIAWLPLGDLSRCTAVVDLGVNANGERSSMSFEIPLCPQTMADRPSSNGILALFPERDLKGDFYRIVSINNENGDTLVNRRFTYTPIPIPKRVSDSVRVAMTKRTQQHPKVLAYYRTMLMSKVYPPAADLRLGTDGTIWLKEYNAPAGSQRWRILDAKGNPAGSVVLSVRLRMAVMSREAIWGIVTDADGFQTLQRYRLKG